MLLSLGIGLFLLFLGIFQGHAAKIYIYEDPETGEVFYSNIPLNENFKIYLKMKKKKKREKVKAKRSLEWNFNEIAFSSNFEKIFQEVAQRFNLDPDLLKAMAKVESNFNPRAISPKGAMGVMQLIPSTAQLVGVDNPFDPIENIWGGAKYLRMLLDEFKDLKLSLAAYNAGPDTVRRFGGIPPYTETVNYVRNVLYYYDLLRNKRLSNL